MQLMEKGLHGSPKTQNNTGDFNPPNVIIHNYASEKKDVIMHICLKTQQRLTDV